MPVARSPLELIDLTDSPTTGASASPATRRLQPGSSLSVSTPSQPSGAEVSHVYLSSFISFIATSLRAPVSQHSVWPRLLSAMSPAVCPHSAAVSNLQEEDRSPRLSPAFPLNNRKSNSTCQAYHVDQCIVFCLNKLELISEKKLEKSKIVGKKINSSCRS